MSASSYAITDAVSYHGRREGLREVFTVPAGTKKDAKRRMHKVARQNEKLATVKAADEATYGSLTAAEIEAMADDWLAQATRHQFAAFVGDNDNEFIDEPETPMSDALAGLDFGDNFELPTELLASLPDWMLEKLEASGGSAFEILSLFEIQPAATFEKQFAVSREDGCYEEML